VRTNEGKPFGNQRSGSQPAPADTGIDWLPPVDILETAASFEVALDICGVPRERIKVRLEHDRLTVSGTRTPAAEGEIHHYRERRVGRFARAFTFRTPVDADGIEAKLADGVLSLSIPKQLPTRIGLE
jgi:HSP20 family protein